MERRSILSRCGVVFGVGALTAGVVVFAAPSQGRASTGCSDCYVVSYPTSSATVGAGTGNDFAFQVANQDPNETLQSLTFAVPADFVITGASGPPGTSVSNLTASSVTLDLPSSAGSTFTVDVTALAPCVSAGSQNWAVSGVDSRGETNEVQWSPAPLSTSLSGECSLAFTGNPAQTSVNSDLLTGFNSTGSPLAVQLLDANGSPLDPAGFSASGTSVTVSIETNPDGGTLSGTTTVVSSDGVARFGDLQINQPGAGYDLAANASGFAQGTSGFFTIAGQIQPCGTGSCSASQSTSTTSASVTTSSAQSGDFVTLGLGGVNLSCDHYNAVSDTADFGVLDSSGGTVANSSATVSLTISKAAVKSVRRPLFRWQVCYGAQTPFPAIPGTNGTTTIGGATYHTGLLLPCFLFSHQNPQPCLLSRRRVHGGAVKLTFVALGDPVGKG